MQIPGWIYLLGSGFTIPSLQLAISFTGIFTSTSAIHAAAALGLGFIATGLVGMLRDFYPEEE